MNKESFPFPVNSSWNTIGTYEYLKLAQTPITTQPLNTTLFENPLFTLPSVDNIDQFPSIGAGLYSFSGSDGSYPMLTNLDFKNWQYPYQPLNTTTMDSVDEIECPTSKKTYNGLLDELEQGCERGKHISNYDYTPTPIPRYRLFPQPQTSSVITPSTTFEKSYIDNSL